MSNLDNYVEYIKEKISKIENITETEIIRYVYLDLGKRFGFDPNYWFGNVATQRKIYSKSRNKEDLNLCMENNTAVCKSLAYICKYILERLEIDIQVEYLDEYERDMPHVYNVVTEKNGRRYIIDLQQDLENIHSNSRTDCFGVRGVRDREPVISRLELEEIDKKLGYINKENYYADEYLYALKMYSDFITKLDEKLDFILENIDIYHNKNMQYIERRWHHLFILKKILSEDEFKKIQFIDCYKQTEKGRDYKNCIVYYSNNTPTIYLYSVEQNKYVQIRLEEFAKQIKNERPCMFKSISWIKKSFERITK